jgi:hypothetical protein
MPSDERDRQFERALHRHLRADAGDAACPDAETLAAYHERTLSLEELTKWKEHISGCARCQETLGLVEETNAVAAQEWETKDVRLQEPAAQRATAAIPGMTSFENVSLEERATAFRVIPSATPAKKSARPKAWRWVAPAGALAAGLLVFVSIREYRSSVATQSPAIQVAENREATAPPATATAPVQFPHANELQLQKRAEPTVPGIASNSGTRQRAGSLSTPAGTSDPTAGDRLAENSTALRMERRGAEKLESGVDSIGAESQLRAKQAAAPRSSGAADAGFANAPAPQPSLAAKPSEAGVVVGGAAGMAGAAKQTEDSAKKSRAVGTVTETVEVQAEAPATGAQLSMSNKSVLRQIAGANPHVILAPDGKHAWRVGAAGIIESSNDAGMNWKAQTSEVNVDLTAGSAPSSKVCWVVGTTGTILRTTDGGKHWKLVTSPLQEDLGGVHAIDAKHASIWSVTNTKSFETADGGLTWTPAANE